MRAHVKQILKDSRAEPYFRWAIKRARGIQMPFELVKNEIYDRQAEEIISRTLSAGSNAIDIGCHKGQYLEMFRKYAPAGAHIAVEPIPQLAQKLTTAFPEVTVRNCALSSESGKAEFFIHPVLPTRSGLKARENLAKGVALDRIEVETMRLDDLVSADAHVDFIKIDVEGAEGLVLAGAVNTLRRCKPVVIVEHGMSSMNAFGISSSQIYELVVHECGLRIGWLHDWLNGSPPLSKSQFAHRREWYFVAYQ